MIQVNLYTDDKRLKTCTVPERWEEITVDQFLLLAQILFEEQEDDLAKARAVPVLYGIGSAVGNLIDGDVLLEQLLPTVDWILTPYTVIKQLLPRIHTKKWLISKNQWYYGPTNGLDNLRVGEYHFAELALSDWQETGAVKYLYQFVAILYRKPKKNYDHYRNPDGDHRVEFNDNLIEIDSYELQKHLPIKYAYAIVLWYRACRLRWKEDYHRIFRNDEVIEGTDSAGNSTEGFHPLIRMVAKSGIYGDFEKVEKMYLVNLFADLVETLKEQERIQEEVKKMRNGS